MVSMRMLLGVVLGMLICMGVGSAVLVSGGSLNAIPPSVVVAPGSTNVTDIIYYTPINTSSIGGNTLTYIVVGSTYFNASIGPVYYYNNSTGTYELINNTVTSFGSTGFIYWSGPVGKYMIPMNVSAASNTPLSTSCNISLTANSVNASFKTGNIYLNVTTATVPVITAVLVGVGLASVIIWRRWS